MRNDEIPGCFTTVAAAWCTLAIVLGLLVSSCGAGALALHGRGAAIAMVAVQAATDADLDALEARESLCAVGDPDCVLAAEVANQPVVAALDAARTAVLLWRDAVAIALLAGDSPDVTAALVSAAVRVMARWADISQVAALFGLELPALPSVVTGLVVP